MAKRRRKKRRRKKVRVRRVRRVRRRHAKRRRSGKHRRRSARTRKPRGPSKAFLRARLGLAPTRLAKPRGELRNGRRAVDELLEGLKIRPRRVRDYLGASYRAPRV